MTVEQVGTGIFATIILAFTLSVVPALGANALEGEVVCRGHSQGDYIYTVSDNGNGTYDVVVLDAALLTAESNMSPEHYVTLPTSPVDLRHSIGFTQLGENFEVVGDPILSQGITTSASTTSLPFDWILNENPPPDTETASVTRGFGGGISWTADLDIRNDSVTGRSVPSDFFFPGQALDASTSVLEFVIGLADDAPTGEPIDVIVTSNTSANGSLINPFIDHVVPSGATIDRGVGDCSLVLPAAPATPAPSASSTPAPSTDPTPAPGNGTEPPTDTTARQDKPSIDELAVTGSRSSSIPFGLACILLLGGSLFAYIGVRARHRPVESSNRITR